MKKKNRLIENIFSMLTLRGLEYILAFLLVPYLLRTLGPESYGSIAFMQGIIGYFILVINYGFNLTAPQDIALAKEDEISSIFSTYFWGTAFLWIGTGVIFLLVYELVNLFITITLDWPLFLAAYLAVIGNVVFPIWFFQGIQEMRYITILNLIGKIVVVIALFILVNSPKDYILAAGLQGSTTLLAGILSWKILYDKYPHIISRPEISPIIRIYKKGWHIFLSSLAVNLYTASDIVILGLLTNPMIVGYYSAADKLINCVRRALSSVSDAVYPFVTQKLAISREEGYQFLKKQLTMYTVGGIAISLLIIFLGPWFVKNILGDQYRDSILVLQILSVLPLFVAISTVFGYETMLPLQMKKEYSYTLITASILNLIMIVPSIMSLSIVGVAICAIVTELFIAIVMGCILWQKRIFLRK